jgi:hypothetical protein
MSKSVIDTDRVELHTTLASDLLYALFGTAICLVFLLGLVQAGGNIFVFVRHAGAAGRRSGPVLAPALVVCVAPMFAMWMIGGWLRVFDRGPTITATATGLSFHPAFGPRNVPWSLVETMELDNRQIAVRLRKRIWSPWVWLSGRTISPYFKELGLSKAKAHDAIAAMVEVKARPVPKPTAAYG